MYESMIPSLLVKYSLRQPDGSWFQFSESGLLLIQSILCFMALFRGMMGIQKSPMIRAKEPYDTYKRAL